MSDSKYARREFIKSLAIFSAVFGIEPKYLYCESKKYNEEFIEDLSDEILIFKKKFQKKLQIVNNFKVASNLPTDKLITEFNKTIKAISAITSNEFQNADETTRQQVFKSITESNNISVTKKDIDIIVENEKQFIKDNYKNNQSSNEKPTVYDASKIVFDVLSFVGTKYSCVLSLKTKQKLPILVNCGTFVLGAGYTAVDAALTGNESRNNTALSYFSLGNATIFSETLEKFYSSNSIPIPFTKEFSDNSPYSFAGEQTNLVEVFRHSPNDLQEESEVLDAIYEKISQETSLLNREEFDKFFENYSERMGNLQVKLYQNQIKLKEENQRKAIIEQRGKTAFYQSIGNLVGFIGNETIKDPTTNKIFNALVGAGVEYMLIGGISGYGMAAIGINLAVSILNNKPSGPSFEKILLKAIRQIQRQLDVIIKNIEVVYETQLVVIEGLNKILAEIQDQGKLAVDKLNLIQQQNQNLVELINIFKIQEFDTKIKKHRDNLTNWLLDNSNIDVLKHLIEWKDSVIAELLNKEFTHYSGNKTYNATKLANIVYFSNENVSDNNKSKRLFGVSLYDSIGVISALRDFNIASNSGQCSLPVVHPVLFYLSVIELIEWLLFSEVPLNEKRAITKSLLREAEQSRQNINNCCRKSESNVVDEKRNPTIEDKSKIYFDVFENTLSEIHKEFGLIHKNEFEFGPSFLQSCRLNSVEPNLSSISLDTNPTDIKAELSKYKSIGSSSNLFKREKPDFGFATFLNRKNDLYYPILNFARDLEIISNINQAKNSKQIYYQTDFRTTKKHDFETDEIIGWNEKIISVDLSLLNNDFRKSNFNSHFDLKVKSSQIQSQPMPRQQYGGSQKIHRFVVTEAYVDEPIFNDWVSVIKKECERTEKDLKTILPNYESMEFIDLLCLLISNWFKKKKIEISNKIIEKFLKNNELFDGAGVPLMVISKLNQVVTGDYLIPYEIDYAEEIFNWTDFSDTLLHYASQDYGEPNKKSRDLFLEIAKDYENIKINPPSDKKNSEFYIKNSQTPLNPILFNDLMCILLKRKALQTIDYCLKTTTEIKTNDCEPYLAETINTLNWLINNYFVEEI